MDNEQVIRVAQLPIIEGVEVLQSIKAEWEAKADEMEALAPTEENKITIKRMRAEERARRNDVWASVKAAIDEASKPAQVFRQVFDECIDQPFKRLDDAAKTKVESIETVQKAGALQQCKDYYAELCQVHGVDFLRWEQFTFLSGFKIPMTEASKRAPTGLFDKINTFLARVACDLDSINDPEVAAEYKSNGLQLNKAIKAVQDRRAAAEQEREAADQRQQLRQRQEEAAAKVEAVAPQEALAPPVVVSPPAVVEAPAPVDEKLLTVKFKATATREKLIQLREWMKAEGIKYE